MFILLDSFEWLVTLVLLSISRFSIERLLVSTPGRQEIPNIGSGQMNDLMSHNIYIFPSMGAVI